MGNLPFSSHFQEDKMSIKQMKSLFFMTLNEEASDDSLLSSAFSS